MFQSPLTIIAIWVGANPWTVMEDNRNSSKCVNPVWNIWAQSCQQVYKIYMPSKGSVNLVWLWMGGLCICLVYKKKAVSWRGEMGLKWVTLSPPGRDVFCLTVSVYPALLLNCHYHWAACAGQCQGLQNILLLGFGSWFAWQDIHWYRDWKGDALEDQDQKRKAVGELARLHEHHEQLICTHPVLPFL